MPHYVGGQYADPAIVYNVPVVIIAAYALGGQGENMHVHAVHNGR